RHRCAPRGRLFRGPIRENSCPFVVRSYSAFLREKRMLTTDQLNSQFALSGVARFDEGKRDMPRLLITTPAAEAHIYLHGAHVTHFQPRGSRPVLFLSTRSNFDAGKPIRGGVPLIFPWFGPYQGGLGVSPERI